jgi:hypothetical protein
MRSRKQQNNPDGVADALAMLHADVRNAVITASVYLTEHGVKHALIGGIAVNAHGYAVNTTDADFLVEDASFFQGAGRRIALAPGPTEVRGERLAVRIDYLSGHAYPNLPILEEEARLPPDPGLDVPVVGLFPLLYMKLSAWRAKDQSHVIGLLNAGSVDVRAFEQWLAEHGTDAARLRERLARLVEAAETGG